MSTVDTNSTLIEGLFSDETSGVIEEFFSESAWLIIENSLIQAGKLGQSQIVLISLLFAMMEQSNEDGDAQSIQDFAAKLKVFVEDDEPANRKLELTREFLTEDVQRVLVTAYELAEKDQSQIEPQHLWAAVLAEAPHFLKQVFEKLPFQVEFEQGEEEADSEAGGSVSVDDWAERLSPVMREALGAEDLTFLALSGGLPLAMERSFSPRSQALLGSALSRSSASQQIGQSTLSEPAVGCAGFSRSAQLFNRNPLLLNGFGFSNGLWRN